MSRPSHSSTAGHIYLELQKKARRDGRPTDEYFNVYVLEGFLDRLSRTSFIKDFVLKGGALLASYDARRPTRDIDLARLDAQRSVKELFHIIQTIAGTQIDDGLVFDVSAASVNETREADPSSFGVRISMPAHIDKATITFHIDINVGDPVVPLPEMISLPRILEGTAEVFGFPIAMIIAEKLVTAIQRGEANTRWRDFADIYNLTGRHELTSTELRNSIAAVSSYRNLPTDLSLSFIEEFGFDHDVQWKTWRTTQRLDDVLPEKFAAVTNAISTFAERLLDERGEPLVWNPTSRSWESVKDSVCSTNETRS